MFCSSVVIVDKCYTRFKEIAMATATQKSRKIIVNLATSADGYIARPNHDIEWLTSRPAPAGFYGMGKFLQSIDTKLLGRKTYDWSLRMGAKFDHHCVFSRQPPCRRG
jgi:dihydrofolate reductase